MLDRGADVDWWSAPEGVEYARRNYKAAADGIEVSRIFVFDRWSGEAERIAAEQADHGIQVPDRAPNPDAPEPDQERGHLR